MPQLMGLLQSDPRGFAAFALRHGARIILELAIMLAFIAFIDAMFTRWHFTDQMKMSRREMREEVKRREGDPRIRARRRELQREMLRRARAIKRAARRRRADHQPDAARRRARVPARGDGRADR